MHVHEHDPDQAFCRPADDFDVMGPLQLVCSFHVWIFFEESWTAMSLAKVELETLQRLRSDSDGADEEILAPRHQKAGSRLFEVME